MYDSVGEAVLVTFVDKVATTVPTAGSVRYLCHNRRARARTHTLLATQDGGSIALRPLLLEITLVANLASIYLVPIENSQDIVRVIVPRLDTLAEQLECVGSTEGTEATYKARHRRRAASSKHVRILCVLDQIFQTYHCLAQRGFLPLQNHFDIMA